MKWINGILMLLSFVIGYVLVFVAAGYDTGVRVAHGVVAGHYVDEHGEV